jgi:hypothetical protein
MNIKILANQNANVLHNNYNFGESILSKFLICVRKIYDIEIFMPQWQIKKWQDTKSYRESIITSMQHKWKAMSGVLMDQNQKYQKVNYV